MSEHIQHMIIQSKITTDSSRSPSCNLKGQLDLVKSPLQFSISIQFRTEGGFRMKCLQDSKISPVASTKSPSTPSTPSKKKKKYCGALND